MSHHDLEREVIAAAILWYGDNSPRRVGMDSVSAALHDAVRNLVDADRIEQSKGRLWEVER